MRAGRKLSARWDATVAVLEANAGQWVDLGPAILAHDARTALARRGEFAVRNIGGTAHAMAVSA